MLKITKTFLVIFTTVAIMCQGVVIFAEEPEKIAELTIQAIDFNEKSDMVSEQNGHLRVSGATAPFWAKYTVDFDQFIQPPNMIELEFANGGANLQPFQIYVDLPEEDRSKTPWETQNANYFIDKIETHNTGAFNLFEKIAGNIPPLTGVHNIYVEWRSSGATGNLKSITLKRYSPVGRDMVIPVFEYFDASENVFRDQGGRLFISLGTIDTYAGYYVNFDDVEFPVNTAEICYANANDHGNRYLQLWVDAPNTEGGGTKIGEMLSLTTGSNDNYVWKSFPLDNMTGISGRRKLFIVAGGALAGNVGALRLYSSQGGADNKSIYLSAQRSTAIEVTVGEEKRYEQNKVTRRSIKRTPGSATPKIYMDCYAPSKPETGTNWICAYNVNFDTEYPVDTVDFEIGVPNKFAGKKVSIYIDNPPEEGGTKIAELETTGTGGYARYTRQSATLLQSVTGTHNVYMCFDDNYNNYTLRSVFFYKNSKIDLESVKITKADDSVIEIEGESIDDLPTDIKNIILKLTGEAIDVKSLEDIVLKKSDGTIVSTTGEYEHRDNTYTITLSEHLQYGESYVLDIPKTVTNANMDEYVGPNIIQMNTPTTIVQMLAKEIRASAGGTQIEVDLQFNNHDQPVEFKGIIAHYREGKLVKAGINALTIESGTTEIEQISLDSNILQGDDISLFIWASVEKMEQHFDATHKRVE